MINYRCRWTKLTVIWVVLLFCVSISVGFAEESGSGTAVSETSSATADAITPEAISVDQIGERIGKHKTRIHHFETVLGSNEEELVVMDDLRALKADFEEFIADQEKLRETNTPADVWFARKITLDGYQKKIEDLAKTLQKRTEALKELGDELAHKQEVWNLTKTSVKSVKLNKSVVNDINEVLASLSKYENQVRHSQSELLQLQNEVFAIRDQINAEEKNLEETIKQGRDQVLKRDSVFIWERLTPEVAHKAWNEWGASLSKQLDELRIYWNKNCYQLTVYLLIFAVVIIAMRGMHRVIKPWGTHGELQQVVRLVEVPIPIAALMAEACFMSGDGVALHVVKAIAGFVAIIPALIVMRRVLDDYMRPLLNAVMVIFTIDLFNQLAYESVSISRVLVLIEALGIIAFILFYLRPKSFASVPEERREIAYRNAKIIGYSALTVAFVAALANIIGFLGLAALLTKVVLMVAVSANLLLAAAHFILAITLFLVTVPPLSLSNLINLKRARILQVSKRILYWIVIVLIIDNGCALAGFGGALFKWCGAVLGFHIAYGNVDVTLGQCLVAILVMVASYQMSRLFVAISETDIVPRLKLQSNSTNVVLFFAQYIPYIICILIACAILGLNIENLAMVVSALSVGIGFGLQNIISNFISGLILLFEPRIVVGGTVEFGDYSGILTHVGMRASVVRLWDGRTVIVPNSELISNKVISIGDAQKVPYRFNLTFAILGDVDVEEVRKVALECARSVETITSNPAPSLVISDISAGYPNFTLYAWSKNYDVQVPTKNALMFAVTKALRERGWQLAGVKTEIVN